MIISVIISIFKSYLIKEMASRFLAIMVRQYSITPFAEEQSAKRTSVVKFSKVLML